MKGLNFFGKFDIIAVIARNLPLAIAVALLAAAILVCPEYASSGARDGLSLCAGAVIPTLFPFMTLCSFTVNSGLCRKLEKVTAPVTKFLFKLPGCSACAVIMGFIGGFPAGINTAARLREQGYINENEAFRLSVFCINAGPAFVISTIGSAMLGSKKAGIILYASLLLSSLTLGIASRFLCSDCESEVKHRTMQSTAGFDFSTALVRSVSESADTLVSVCSWVILFCCLNELLCCVPQKYEHIVEPLRLFLEVTSGCREAALSGMQLTVIAAILGWSGLSVVMQVLAPAKICGSKLSIIIASRFVSAALSALFCSVICKLFPVEISPCTISVFAGWNIWSSSAPASVGLIFMCALLILDCSSGTAYD